MVRTNETGLFKLGSDYTVGNGEVLVILSPITAQNIRKTQLPGKFTAAGCPSPTQRVLDGAVHRG